MALQRGERFGMPWEDLCGYTQAVKADDTIYISRQLSHDDQGNVVGPAPLDDSGRIRDHSNMETQMRQTYANAKKILDLAPLWTTSSRRSFTSQIWTQRSPSWPGAEGSVWLQEAHSGKHHSSDAPAGPANAAH